jgi:hypothetical protein
MYEYQFLKALGFTIVIETAVLFIIVRRIFSIPRSAISNSLLLFSGIISSGLTLPYLWFVLPAFIKGHQLYVATGEASAVFVEMAIYWFVLKLNIKRCFFLSVVANLCSYSLGVLLLRHN